MTTKLLYRLRHRKNGGYQFVGIKLFDVGHPSGSDAIESNLHVHIALNSYYTIPIAIIQNLWRDLGGGEYVRIKSSKTNAVFSYFAKRMAGQIGHRNENLHMQDVFSVSQYDRVVRGSRYFTASFPKGLARNVVPIYSAECPECGSKNMVVDAISFDGSFIAAKFGWEPT